MVLWPFNLKVYSAYTGNAEEDKRLIMEERTEGTESHGKLWMRRVCTNFFFLMGRVGGGVPGASVPLEKPA